MASISVETALASEIVLTSDELLDRLVNAGQSSMAARQALKRASGSGRVWRSEHCRLPGNQRLYALPQIAGTDKFFQAAASKIAQSTRHGIARCLTALAQDGVLLGVDAQKLLAAPTTEAAPSKHLPFEDELTALEELGVHICGLMSGQMYLVGRHLDESQSGAGRALKAVSRLRIESLFARIVIDSLRRQNILSWNRYDIPLLDKGYVSFNSQLFTGSGYSCLRPMLRWEGKKAIASPVLLDVHAKKCQRYHVEAFLERIKRATFGKERQQNHLGIIAAINFSDDAWKVAKKQYLLTMNLRQVYGNQALEALVQIENLLRNLDCAVPLNLDCDIQTFSRLLGELKTNPVVTSLRSIGYEALCALILRSEGYGDVEMGREVPFQKSTRDVDVYGRRADDLRVVECKALLAGNELLSEDVRKFYLQTVPAFIKWYDENRGKGLYKRVQAEIWTTGTISDASREALKEIKAAPNVEQRLRASEDVEPDIPSELRERAKMLIRAIAMTTDDLPQIEAAQLPF